MVAPPAQHQKVIFKKDIQRDKSSYVDPQGFVFHWNENIYRYIHPNAVNLFGRLLDSGLLNRLQESSGLVPTQRAEIIIDDLEPGLILAHDKVPTQTYCTEWCPSMLRDAGRLTLDLAITLIDEDLCLVDAYPWNVLFDGVRPVFIDVGSIAPLDKVALWPAQEQFESFFLRPLALAMENKGRVARNMLLDNINGIGLAEFHCMVSTSYRLLHPGLSITLWLDRWLQRSTKTKERIRALSERQAASASTATRKIFMKRLRRRLDAFTFDSGEDPWASYYRDIDPRFDKEAKLSRIRQILDQEKPATVLDLGCNTGVFSLEAAIQGARVLAVDSSESCIETLYSTARAQDLTLTPLISNVVCPTPPFGFMGNQYPGLWQRVRSEMVFCLGLMHHLHVTGRQSFERISELMNAVASRVLVFEYIGTDDANMPHLSGRRDINYNIDTVEAALRPHFPKIQRLESDRPSRRLLLCQR